MIYREEKQPQIPVNHCAWCGSYDLGIGWQQNEAIVTFRRNGLLGNRLKYVICRNCGAVLYQYVAEQKHMLWQCRKHKNLQSRRFQP